MPSRSDRDVFGDAFDVENPFEDLDLEDIYKEIQWGNDPKEIIDIDAPEPLIALGYLAQIHYISGTKDFKENQIHIAIGAKSNYVYLFPKNTTRIPDLNNTWKKGLPVKETHYYSDKGNEECYYYHEHEKPYPVIYHHRTVSVLIPSNNNGKPSYRVIKEGIVG